MMLMTLPLLVLGSTDKLRPREDEAVAFYRARPSGMKCNFNSHVPVLLLRRDDDGVVSSAYVPDDVDLAVDIAESCRESASHIVFSSQESRIRPRSLRLLRCMLWAK